MDHARIFNAAAGRELDGHLLTCLGSACGRFGINTPVRIAMFAAQCAHESRGFEVAVEDLNYSDTGMANTWPNRFAARGANGAFLRDARGRFLPNDLAKSLHRKPEQIANISYAYRGGNGGPETGDGWRYRGRGWMQLTTKNNYRRAATDLDYPMLLTNPEIAERPDIASLVSAHWWQANGANRLADARDTIGLSKLVNLGNALSERVPNGLEDRLRRTARALAIVDGVAL